MENVSTQPAEKIAAEQNVNNAVGLPVIYTGASQAKILTEKERNELSASFKDDEYELRPDGKIYLPHALIRHRLNTVIGASEWAMLLHNSWEEPNDEFTGKVYYDGIMYIRGCFIARSTGEGRYDKRKDGNSPAAGKEAAKSDCIVRCAKDLGIGLEAFMPMFIRRWQRDNALKVYVEDKGKKEIAWRRKDLDPYWNETGLVPTTPTVPTREKPAAREVTEEWLTKIRATKTRAELTVLWNESKSDVYSWPELKKAFYDHRDTLKKEVV